MLSRDPYRRELTGNQSLLPSRSMISAGRLSDSYQFRLNTPGHLGPVRPGDHVDLAAHPELAGKVEPRFDGKTGVRQDEPHIVGFEVIQMSTAAVDIDADVVTGAVREPVAVTCGADHFSRRIVRIAAPNRLIRGERLLHSSDRGVASGANNIEDSPLALAWL